MTAAAVLSSPTAAELIARAESELACVTDAGRLDAELLLADAAGLARAAVMAHPERRPGIEAASRFEAAVARRACGEPLAYLLGRREFYSLDLIVAPEVLVPRPETEALVDAALERLIRPDARVLELGTGSGAVALALKHARPALDVTATECDSAALGVARANGAALGLDIRWLESDWFASVAAEQYDLVVSNPPYVCRADPHFAGGLAHEPRLALDGGRDGLDAFRAIFAGVSAPLAPGGWLIVEHGYDQREALKTLAVESGLRFEAGIDDLAGRARVACLRRAHA